MHRGMAATGVSWLCIDGDCALLFQMCGRWDIPDAGPRTKRSIKRLCALAFFSNTPVAARHQQETRRVGVEYLVMCLRSPPPAMHCCCFNLTTTHL